MITAVVVKTTKRMSSKTLLSTPSYIIRNILSVRAECAILSDSSSDLIKFYLNDDVLESDRIESEFSIYLFHMEFEDIYSS
jgi:hypothetical protein